MEAIEAQLERVTTVADKLDATLKNLNVTLDKTNSIFKSSTDALSSNLNSSLVKQQNVEAVNNLAQNINTTSANLSGGEIATDQVNTNLEVINKAAEIMDGAVERSYRLCDRLFSIHKATQTDINTVPSPEDFNISCSLEVSELFHKYPILPSSFIIISVTLISIYLLYKMYRERDTRNSYKRGETSISQRLISSVHQFITKIKNFIACAMQYSAYQHSLRQIHKLKWFIVGYVASWYIGLILDLLYPKARAYVSATSPSFFFN